MDGREARDVLHAGVRLSSVVAQLLHADDALNEGRSLPR